MKAGDLRGTAQLATHATMALADVVEAMHERIARLPGSRAALDGRTRGITGLVYRSVRGITRAAGGSVDAVLATLAPLLLRERPAREGEDREAPRRRESLVAALNGVLGDHLAATGNPLAIPMALRIDGRPLPLERSALLQRVPRAGEELLVLVHGLCMGDLQWQREGHDHGAALARELGLTAVYAHYNSGMPIADNGRLLARRLQELVAAWPRPVRRVVLLGHSMGGLVARSALHHARQDRLEWVARASDLVCLGTPHHGAPLERIGNWVEVALGAAPYAAPLARIGGMRSAGITGLRHGAIADRGERHPVPLPRGVRCFAIAASLGAERAGLKARLLGDGLVPVPSALGRHADPEKTLRFPQSRQRVAWSTGHLQLLDSREVLATLLRWL